MNPVFDRDNMKKFTERALEEELNDKDYQGKAKGYISTK